MEETTMNNRVLLEIGVEELPARFIDEALEQFKEKTTDWLEQSRISFKHIDSFSTPRRLSLMIYGIAANQGTKREGERGRKAGSAKARSGERTKAAIGCSKSKANPRDELYIKQLNGEAYLAIVTVEARNA